MATQDIFIIEPNSDEQTAALKAFVEALKIKFEISKGYLSDSKQSFVLSDEQKKTLDKRLEADKNNFIPAREALNKLRQKHEL